MQRRAVLRHAGVGLSGLVAVGLAGCSSDGGGTETEALPDEGDQASRESETELELQEINRQRNQLREIEAALRRLDQGEYGYCESCGLDIGINRLNVRPVATLCIDCKSLEEARNGH